MLSNPPGPKLFSLFSVIMGILPNKVCITSTLKCTIKLYRKSFSGQPELSEYVCSRDVTLMCNAVQTKVGPGLSWSPRCF